MRCLRIPVLTQLSTFRDFDKTTIDIPSSCVTFLRQHRLGCVEMNRECFKTDYLRGGGWDWEHREVGGAGSLEAGVQRPWGLGLGGRSSGGTEQRLDIRMDVKTEERQFSTVFYNASSPLGPLLKSRNETEEHTKLF